MSLTEMTTPESTTPESEPALEGFLWLMVIATGDVPAALSYYAKQPATPTIHLELEPYGLKGRCELVTRGRC
jgi:hypothetical protein